MSSKTQLEVRGLKAAILSGKSPLPIVQDVSFNLVEGKTLALVGESGCGKTMTAMSILKVAFTPPALPPEGVVEYEGQNLIQLNDREMQQIRGGEIAMIFQDPSSSLNPLYPIGEQLMEAALLHLPFSEEECYQRCLEVLQQVGMASAESRMEDYPHQLSGGMKQRVMIAMALLANPKILIADEPTTALDVTIQAQLIELIREIQERSRMSMLLITHDMSVVAELAHDVAVMYAGQIVETGSVYQIFNNPRHPYTQGLFAAIDRSLPKGHLKTIKGTVPNLRHLPSGCHFHPRCPYAFERCYHEKVPLYTVTEKPLHQSRCFLEDVNSEPT